MSLRLKGKENQNSNQNSNQGLQGVLYIVNLLRQLSSRLKTDSCSAQILEQNYLLQSFYRIVMILCCFALLAAIPPSSGCTSIFLWGNNPIPLSLCYSGGADPTPTRDWACDPGWSSQSTAPFCQGDWFRNRHKIQAWESPTSLVSSG